jgi:hypothetical protein
MMRSLFIGGAIGLCFIAPQSQAQLRPLEPARWRLFSEAATLSVEIGGSMLIDQRASLAGETGNLWEAGNFSLAWRTGRVILEASGTAQRFFRETSTFDDPYPDVEPAHDGRRHDSGDYRVSTTVRLTPSAWPIDGIVRFGTRLPTTDNTTGLDRDAVDFFATIGASRSVRFASFSGEAGLGIHTTREQRFEQDDLFLYSGRAELRAGPFIPSAAIIGQIHGTGHSEIRGVEDLGEIRLGVRVGRARWLRAEYVKGYETFSPSYGFIVTAGFLH